MNQNENVNRLSELVNEYNEAMMAEVVDQRKLNDIEGRAQAVVGEIKKVKKAALYKVLSESNDPMVEAARVFSYEVPSYRLVKDGGIVTGMEICTKVFTINPIDFTGHMMKLNQSKSTNQNFPGTGIFKSGHTWEYRAEKLGYLLAYRALKELGGSEAALAELKKTYFIREVSMKEEMGATPTSNSQIVKLLQSIIDMLVFVPNEKGENSIKCNGRDVAFLLNCYTSHGSGAGAIKVLKGNKIACYIFEAVHMIVTGKPYEVQYKKRKEDVAETTTTVRKPVKATATKKADESKPDVTKVPKGEPVQAEDPDVLPTFEEMSEKVEVA